MKSIHRFRSALLLLTSCWMVQHTATQELSIGLITDIQYCDCQTAGSRHYSESITKLEQCIQDFNKIPVDFMVDLGDRIDHDFESFEPVEAALRESGAPVFFVPGNHDFSIDDNKKKSVITKTGSKTGYHSFHQGKWKFIFLHGLALSLPASSSPLSVKHLLASQKLKHLADDGAPNAYDWNGGLGGRQTRWLKKQLAEAETDHLNVIIFCHQPISDGNAHSLWEYNKVKDILKSYPGKVFWINGHDHRGGFEQEDNISMITIHGMVEESTNAYAVLKINEDQLSIKGFGRQPDLHPGR